MKTEKEFEEHDFVAILLPLLFQNGIYKIKEKELEKKLYFYYQKPEFKELFRNIFPTKNFDEKSINLSDGFYREKYFGCNVIFEQCHSDILHLNYDIDHDFSFYEQLLSSSAKTKIRQLAQELGIRNNIEKNSKVKLNIYGVNPNNKYLLVSGEYYFKPVEFELITDGTVSSVEPGIGNEDYFYKSPLNEDSLIQIKKPKVVYLSLENATYTIIRGKSANNVCYCDVNTEILDTDKLKKISEIANENSILEDSILSEEKPFVKRLILK